MIVPVLPETRVALPVIVPPGSGSERDPTTQSVRPSPSKSPGAARAMPNQPRLRVPSTDHSLFPVAPENAAARPVNTNVVLFWKVGLPTRKSPTPSALIRPPAPTVQPKFDPVW